MNFLGHIFFSRNNIELMHANLFGDFVKGRNLDMYEPIVKEGIILHRTIDSYIDQHPDVRELYLLLSPSLPKVAGIAIDLYFDHFLALHWEKYHPQSLNNFLEPFYTYKISETRYPNDQFLNMLFYLKRGRWMSEYQKLDGIGRACEGVSSRISFPNSLKYGRMVLEDNYETVQQAFELYISDAIQHFSGE